MWFLTQALSSVSRNFSEGIHTLTCGGQIWKPGSGETPPAASRLSRFGWQGTHQREETTISSGLDSYLGSNCVKCACGGSLQLLSDGRVSFIKITFSRG